MTIQIRNMESNRCIALVRKELNKLGLPYKTVELGKIELKTDISVEYLKMLDCALKESGLELISENRTNYIEKIKSAIQQLIYLSDELPKTSISEYISKRVNYDYAYLSNLFSSSQGITIEKYIITQKIARVKELLVYGELTLNDIAFQLGYSSVAHLSNQFKKITGLTATHFRLLRQGRNHAPESLNVNYTEYQESRI
jgi:AraC-like DNA-binding protein